MKPKWARFLVILEDREGKAIVIQAFPTFAQAKVLEFQLLARMLDGDGISVHDVETGENV